MRTARAIAASLALLAAARGAEDPGAVLEPGAGLGDWRPLLEALASKGAVVAPFTEHRYFPFRREPTVLRGVLRLSPERGLSLQYTEPEPCVVIADQAGLVLRDRHGRVRELPSGSRDSGAIASLVPIMRFDLASLYPRFVIHARRLGPDWSLLFTPRDPAAAHALGEILVRGSGSDVRRIEFRRSASQRVEIDVGDARTGGAFGADELRRFFR